jgi:hypothetical protein
VHPDHVVGPEQLDQAVGKQRIDPQIAVQMIALVVDQVRAVMQQRPQRAVGEAGVELVVVGAAEVDGGVVDRPVLRAMDLGTVRTDLAAPAEPQAAARAHRHPHCRGQATGGGLLRQRHAVGYHHQSTGLLAAAHSASSQRRDSRIAAWIKPTIE